MRHLIILFLAFTSCLQIKGQVPNFKITNYTVDDGLPSNECHGVVQDSLGYIWIATDRGLVKWDGYEFEVWGSDRGLTDMTCIGIYKDKKENLWINTISRGLYILQSGSDTIRAYKNNNTIFGLNNFFRFIEKIAFDDLNDLIVSSSMIGTYRISESGKATKLSPSSGKPSARVSILHDEIFVTLDNSFTIGGQRINDLKEIPIEISNNYYNQFKNTEWKGSNNSRAYLLSDTSFQFFLQGSNYLIINDSIVRQENDNYGYDDIIQYQNSQYLTCQGTGKGVKFFTSISKFAEDEYLPIITGVSSTDIFEDKVGNLWVTSIDHGLFHLSPVNVTKVDTLAINDILLVENKYFITKEKNKIIVLDQALNENNSYSLANSELSKLAYDKNQGLLYVSGYPTYILDVKQKKIINRNSLITRSSNGIKVNDDSSILTWGDRNLAYFKNDTSQSRSLLPKSLGPVRINMAHAINDQEHLIGTTQGLIKITSDNYEFINVSKSEPWPRVNDIYKESHSLFIATTGRGLIIMENDTISYNINESSGLISNNIERVINLNNGQLAATSKSGFSIMKKTSPSSKYEIFKNYDKRSGLPSNQVTSLVSTGDSLIVGTSKGLCIIKQENKQAPILRPIIEKATINNKRSDLNQTNRFKHQQNNISFQFKALDFEQLGKIKYRYRLNENVWSETRNTSSTFSALPPSNYLFEVQAQNIDGVWGDATSISFSISPPWWKTNAFILASLIAVCLLLYKLYNNRIHEVKKEAETKEELRQLEMSALQAQMNPHFIFNCLNSIQSYIISNEREKAMSYLSRFAKLVRQTLSASSKEKISLKTEIDMLENYLSLEKLRHKDKFDYSIITDTKIDIIETNLPPLLVQPFVENAVIHGMRGKKDKGLIEISFKEENNSLNIKIADNGSGIKNPSSKRAHDSMGVSITSKRLKLLNLHKTDDLTIDSSSSDQGTTVVIQVAQ